MQIEDYGRAMFLVTSHGDPFTVDLLSHRGNGKCDCLHFKTRLQPMIETDQKLNRFQPGDKYRCPHINFARGHLLDRFLAALAKQFPDTNQDQ